LKIRFQADADLHVPIIKGLRRREPSIAFMTANEAGLAGIDDWAVLAVAASNNRVLVSHDISTMPEAFSRFIQKQTSPGSIYDFCCEVKHAAGPSLKYSQDVHSLDPRDHERYEAVMGLEESLRKLFSKAFESRTFANELADAKVLESKYPI